MLKKALPSSLTVTLPSTRRLNPHPPQLHDISEVEEEAREAECPLMPLEKGAVRRKTN